MLLRSNIFTTDKETHFQDPWFFYSFPTKRGRTRRHALFFNKARLVLQQGVTHTSMKCVIVGEIRQKRVLVVDTGTVIKLPRRMKKRKYWLNREQLCKGHRWQTRLKIQEITKIYLKNGVIDQIMSACL